MKLTITEAAVKCFVDEWGITRGESVQIYARYGGGASHEGAYSLGFERKTPNEIGISVTEEGITFYVEQTDMWFLDGRDLNVDYDEKLEEIVIQLS